MSSEPLRVQFNRPLKAVSRAKARGADVSLGQPAGEGAPGGAALAQESSGGNADQARRSAELAAKERAAEEKLARLGELIAGLERQRAEMLEANEEEIISLSLSIAEKVLQHEIENGRYKIGEVVRSTLRAVRNKGAIVVKANPRDYELTRQAVERSQQSNGAEGITIVADESVAPASCCIETESGRVSSEISERLKRIERGLLKVREDSDGV